MKNIPSHKVYFSGSFISLILAVVLPSIFNNLDLNGGPANIIFGFFTIFYLIVGFFHLRKSKHNPGSGA